MGKGWVYDGNEKIEIRKEREKRYESGIDLKEYEKKKEKGILKGMMYRD